MNTAEYPSSVPAVCGPCDSLVSVQGRDHRNRRPSALSSNRSTPIATRLRNYAGAALLLSLSALSPCLARPVDLDDTGRPHRQHSHDLSFGYRHQPGVDQFGQPGRTRDNRGGSGFRNMRQSAGALEHFGNWSALQQRIMAGVSSARLTHNEADRLLSNISRVSMLQQQLQQLEQLGQYGTFSAEERSRIAHEARYLGSRVMQELQDKQVY